MRFNPSDFLRIAKWLIDADVEEREAILRTSIGRAYYATHLDSREWLIMHGCQIPKDIDAHKSVITELRRCGLMGLCGGRAVCEVRGFSGRRSLSPRSLGGVYVAVGRCGNEVV